jgi:hypothetical protein
MSGVAPDASANKVRIPWYRRHNSHLAC